MQKLSRNTHFRTSEEPQRTSEEGRFEKVPSEVPLRSKTNDLSGLLTKPQTSEASEAFLRATTTSFFPGEGEGK